MASHEMHFSALSSTRCQSNRLGRVVAFLQSFNAVVTSILTRFRSSLDVRVARVPSNTYSLSLQKSEMKTRSATDLKLCELETNAS